MENKFEIRLPKPDGSWVFARFFNSEKDAIKWLQKIFSADKNGKINVIYLTDRASPPVEL